MYTRLRPAGVRSSGNFISTRYAPVGPAGTFTFEAKAPGNVCAAIANTSSSVYGVAPGFGAEGGGGGGGGAAAVRAGRSACGPADRLSARTRSAHRSR